jgi:flagellar operon protein
MAVTKVPSLNIPNSTPSAGRMTSNIDVGQGPSFQQTLLREIPGAAAQIGTQAPGAAKEALRFSQHAVERMKSRGIRMSPEVLGRLESAVQRAAQKGSRDALVLSSESAFVVSVKNNTVVTVMDREMMKENVFTNIDSTVLM